ncbi:MAG: hypothetical protein GY863_25250, partial [bacterium]|nr:hypothetical protein [bacterium]
YFRINDKLYFVDLPGYGFAGVSKKLRYEWKGLIDTYLSESKELKLVLMICDIRRGLTDMDLQLIEWLDFTGIKIQLMLTKSDKLSKNKSAKTRNEIVKQYDPVNEPIIFSSLKKTGVRETLALINKYTAVKHDT